MVASKTPARERNRIRIVDAALALWMQRPEASMDDVAVAAGVVRRTLYSHFDSREELIVAVARCAAEFIDAPTDAADPEPDPAARLAQLSTRLWQFGHHMRLMIGAASQADPDAIAAIRGRITAAVAAIVAEGQKTGQFSKRLPPQVIAALLESAAVVLHEAATTTRGKIGQRDVAINALVVAGVDEADAVDVVRRHVSPRDLVITPE